jgi:site-specific DNA recombinase
MTVATKRRPLDGTGTERAIKHVAIYCRQSVADDLEFNSIHAQRESVERYVESQRCLGWVALPERFDDHGYSGGSTDRPAYQRLLEAVATGTVSVVAVVRVDRLARRQIDLLGALEIFEKHSVLFVSVTESFNTTTTGGRALLSMLGVFAQLERETCAERTREKMAATRRRGMWTGGVPPLGYEVQDKRLVIIPDEAEHVREISQLYLDLGSLLGTVVELNRRGWRTKGRKRGGERLLGKAWDKGSLRFLLTNPLYVGKIRHHGEVHDGVHEAIIDEQTWAAVQHRLAENAKGGPKHAKFGGLLLGLLRCGACGSAMTSHHAKRGNRRYSSYVCVKAQKQGAAACPGSRAPVGEMERVVVERIRDIGRDPRLVREAIAAAKRGLKERRPELERELRRLEKDRARLEAERGNLLDAVSQAANGNGSASVLQRLGEVEVALAELKKREDAGRGEVAVLENAAIDEEDLTAALGSFEPVWDQLFPQERARVLHLLLERVTFDAGKGEVELVFRPGGIRALAREDGKETE